MERCWVAIFASWNEGGKEERWGSAEKVFGRGALELCVSYWDRLVALGYSCCFAVTCVSQTENDL